MSRDVEEHRVAIEEKIVRITNLILASKWKTGVTARALAEEWGIGTNRVYEYVTEANARIRMELGARSALTIQRTLTKVARKGRQGVMPGDLSASVQAAKVLADLAGWNEPLRKPENDAPSETKLTVEFVTPERPKSE